jgi:two-component system OmpR family response regulator
VHPVRPPGVLVLDDEPALRDLLGRVLSEAGFRVWTAATGAEAVAVYAAHGADIDVALLDVRLPDTGGPEVMAALRRLDPGVRCCLMSGSLGGQDVEALLAAGASHVFAKPFDLAEVARVLRQVAAGGGPADRA